MKCSMTCSTAIVVVMGALFAQEALAQKASIGPAVPQLSAPSPQTGSVYVPASSRPRPGNFFHTNYVLRTVNGAKPTGVQAPSESAFGGKLTSAARPDAAEPNIILGQLPETPASMGCVYVNSPANRSTGCVPNFSSGTGGPSAAGYGAIAIVDAYDNPDAASDLKTFDNYWGLPTANFTKIYANGNGDCSTPPANADWSGEESLDIEWAHVFASKAHIILVEACSASSTDLYYAEQVAFEYIRSNYPAGGQVSNSWGGGEFSGETADDKYFADWYYAQLSNSFNSTHIVAFASSGDSGYLGESGTAGYPSVNPWVVSAGGTSVERNSANNAFYAEYCWSGTGGGTSTYETYVTSFTGGNTGPWADFQYPMFGQANRATPDLSFNADPASGVYVYNQYAYGGWVVFGGTSVASPSLASIVNRAGNKLGTYDVNPINNTTWFNNEENNLLYAQLYSAKDYKANFYDVTVGSNGGPNATAGWDYCTGVGSPRGLVGK